MLSIRVKNSEALKSLRFIDYDKNIQGFVLNNFIINNKLAKTRFMCAATCTRTPVCKSFNFFRNMQLCELSSSDIVWDPQEVVTSSTGVRSFKKRFEFLVLVKNTLMDHLDHHDSANFLQTRLASYVLLKHMWS